MESIIITWIFFILSVLLLIILRIKPVNKLDAIAYGSMWASVISLFAGAIYLTFKYFQ